ncbi:MAG: hypothetical protein ABR555_16670 [Pyrinomonadaceae bacterium]
MKKSNASRTVVSVASVFILAGILMFGLAFKDGSGSLAPTVGAKSEDNGRRCSEQSAKGTYGFALVGSFAAIGPVATSGTTTFDGEGHDSGKYTLTTFGATEEFTFTGTYTVNPDCTGTATLNVTPVVFGFSVLHFTAVATDNDKEIKWLITDPGIVIAGTLDKQ